VTIFIALVVIVICLIVLYALVGRPWLKTTPWGQRFLTWVEPVELALFKKSETILMGRLLWVGGLFVSLYDGIAAFATSLDLTPITTRVFDWLSVPQDMRGLTVSALIGIIGLIINRLRATVTKPLELVAVSDSTVTTKQAAAIAKADVAKDQAVAAVKAS
jgi:hypothetical protein